MSLIAGAMKGIGRAGPGVADMMVRATADERRAREREEELEQRRQQRREELEYQRETSLMLAGARSGGSSGGGSGSGARGPGGAIDEGSLAEEAAAARMGVSVPEFRRTRQAMREGNVDAVEGRGPIIDPAVLEARTRVFALIAEEVMHGKDIKDVVAGRRGQQQIDLTEDVLSGRRKSGVVGEAMAASEAKPIFGGDSNVTRNQFTGATSTTAVGNAEIRRKSAEPAGASRAEIAQERAAINDQIKPIDDEIASLRAERQRLQKDASTAYSQRQRQAMAQSIADIDGRIAAAQERRRPFEEMQAELNERLRAGNQQVRPGRPTAATTSAPDRPGTRDNRSPSVAPPATGTTRGGSTWKRVEN